MRKITDVIVTHDHHDHYFPTDLFSRAQGMSRPITFHCPKPTSEALQKAIVDREAAFISGKRKKTSEVLVASESLEYFMPKKISDYTVIPLRANHGNASLCAMMYILQSNGKSILWAHDTGKFTDDTVNYIKNSGIRFDMISRDCTLKRGEQITQKHMDLDWCIEMVNMLKESKNADDNTIIVLNFIELLKM